MKVVIDTNVLVAALRSECGASRRVIRECFNGALRPFFGTALWLEYEDLLRRDIWGAETTLEERMTVLDALASCGVWVSIYFGWRPNLVDEGDNHLFELAVAGSADAIVTHNTRDFSKAQLSWSKPRILTPAEVLELIR